ncbi:hypothetical protein JT318_gp62 [Pseudomonas phage PspYZU01]|uniref:Uncharacterized protein n=1 Tax=Pseudomonas phage PspYZU01 TaxID=1983555 RepID=A0A2U7NMW9_9CAUD|nr:hypothetical protein JT318_gp62 [Pseudomonas phage PspYZU01]ASD51947.1 hypothetical protein PspYZU01_62 [Pseudomonas phage PspYZU01]
MTRANDTQFVFLPDALLADCRLPVWGGGAWEDAAGLAVLRREAILECNLRLTEARRLQREAKQAAAPYEHKLSK